MPKPDADGLDIGGIRTVDIAAPVGTNTGWNLMAAGPRGTDLCGLSGAFFPFAAQRRSGWRPAIRGRHSRNATRIMRASSTAVEQASKRLVKQRLLLDEDARTLVNIARENKILRTR